MSGPDVVVIGGGHNGLTAAAVMGRAGRAVVVCEASDRLGGLAAPRPFCDGYTAPGILHDTERVRERVVAQLDLERHGLEWRDPPELLVPGDDGAGILIAADGVPLGLAGSDVQGHEHLRAFIDRVRRFVERLVDAPPPPIDAAGPGGLLKLARSGLALRRLGRADMSELLRVAPMSVSDWLGERIASELFKGALAAAALQGRSAGPLAPGTAANLLLHECTKGRGIKGGPPALVAALAAACRTAGVELRTGAAVAGVRTCSGKVEGVTLAGGETIDAEVVVATCDPRRLFLELVESFVAPPGLERQIALYRCRGTTAKVHLALRGPLVAAARPDLDVEAALIAGSLLDVERAHDAAKYRALPSVPVLDVRVPSLADASLAPPGCHVVSILVHFVPRDLEGGWSEARRRELGDAVVRRLEQHAPGVSGAIAGIEVLSPADLENELRLTGGHVHHGEMAIDQYLSLRPASRCGRYRTPIEGLYLAGSGSHPGGGITCGPGALGAAAALAGS